MKPLTSLALAAGIALAGTAAAFAADTQPTHHMTITLPDGGTGEITYTGNVAPKVTFHDSAFSPFAPIAFANDPGFAMLERAQAGMQRQMKAMQALFRSNAATLSAPGMSNAVLSTLPPGTQGYSFISTMSGNGTCMQSVQITSTGHGKPNVVRRSSGNCGSGKAGTAPMDRPEATSISYR
jgi:hypothetical protein